MYTNADLKIFLFVSVHKNIVPWKFRILNPKNSRVIYTRNVCEMLVYKHTETIEYVKN